MDYEQLQAEVGEWSREQFGTEQPARYPLLGAGEEFGELTHSVLKKKQGIRLDEEDVGTEAEIDAVGDIIVYLMDFCERGGVEAARGFEVSHIKYEARDLDDIGALIEGLKEYGKLCEYDDIQMCDGGVATTFAPATVASIINALDAFCKSREGIGSIDQCIEEAWSEVSEREWDAEVEV